MSQKKDLTGLERAIGSGYASEREPAIGNAILEMIKENRQSDRYGRRREIIIIILAFLTLVVGFLSYIKLN